MSEEPPSSARVVLQQAQAALRNNERLQARQLATQAARLDPTLEEPWLILAALSGPDASLVFLRRALEVNPNSQRARKGIHWAIQRQRASRTLAFNEQIPITLPETVRLERTHPAHVPHTRPVRVRKTAPARTRPLLLSVAILAVVLLAVAGLLAWSGFRNGWIVIAQDSSAPRPIGALVKPSLTATNTPTATPTSTPTDTPTATATQTLLPTSTDTEVPTETPSPVPTDTLEPVEEQQEPPPAASGGERWIDVNLSTQSLAAYEGDSLVNTFPISSGTWEHPTVTGQYNIYVKYTYANMSGPGYYLPDVPYVMYFYKGYGLHGTYWHNNFGTPMSHGCVNLRTEDAGWLFDWASIGTLVNIHD